MRVPQHEKKNCQHPHLNKTSLTIDILNQISFSAILAFFFFFFFFNAVYQMYCHLHTDLTVNGKVSKEIAPGSNQSQDEVRKLENKMTGGKV